MTKLTIPIGLALLASLTTAHADMYLYSCKIGKSNIASPLVVDSEEIILGWQKVKHIDISNVSIEENPSCGRVGWHVEYGEDSFNFCTWNRGSANIQKQDRVIAVCDLKETFTNPYPPEKPVEPPVASVPPPQPKRTPDQSGIAEMLGARDVSPSEYRPSHPVEPEPEATVQPSKPPLTIDDLRGKYHAPPPASTPDPVGSWIDRWSAQQKMIADANRSPPPEPTPASQNEQLSCSSEGVKNILYNGTFGKFQSYVEQYKKNSNANSSAGIALEQVSHWKGTVANIRETNRTPGNVSCAAEFEWSNMPPRESLQMVGLILLTEGIKDPSCIKINYQVQPLLDKPGQIYVSWRCNDG